MSLKEGQVIPEAENSFMERIFVWASTGLGVGQVSTAPGTVGSLWGPPLALGLQLVNPHWLFMLLSGVLLFAAGIPICAAGIRHYQTGDPKHVVFDEIAAFAFVYFFVPVTWGTAIIGFLLFRLFDISKLWPIKKFEGLPGPWGVMADDTIAGIMACCVLTAMWVLIGPF